MAEVIHKLHKVNLPFSGKSVYLIVEEGGRVVNYVFLPW